MICSAIATFIFFAFSFVDNACWMILCVGTLISTMVLCAQYEHTISEFKEFIRILTEETPCYE